MPLAGGWEPSTLRGLGWLLWVTLPRARLGYPCKLQSQGGASHLLPRRHRHPVFMEISCPHPWHLGFCKVPAARTSRVIVLPSLSPARSCPTCFSREQIRQPSLSLPYPP